MATVKDVEQDDLIRSNAARITRNEEAIKRQTEALEKIRDHYYPPPEKWWKRGLGFCVKVLCVVLAYAGGVQAVDWYVNVRKSSAMAAQCADVARRLFFQEGNAEGALQFFDRAVELDEGAVRYRIERAFAKNMASMAQLFDLGRPLTPDERAAVDDALAEATFLQTSEPDDPLPHVLAAQALVCRGEKKAAVESADRAVALAPDRGPIRVSACAMHFMAGDVAGARAQLAEAERLDASLPLIPCWKGMLALTVDRDAAAARAFFAEMTRRAPRLALGYAMLGRAHLAEKRPDLAAAHAAFTQALAADPTQRVALLGQAEAYTREGRPLVARLWLDRALAADAKCLPALVARARLRENLGDAAAARADLSAALDLAPFRADLYLARARLHEKSGQAAEAQADREQAAALAEAASDKSALPHAALWHKWLDRPVGYAFAPRFERQAVYDCGDFTVETYVQANGPGTTQRVFLALPKNAKGRLPGIVVPFYFPEAMLGFDPATGGVEHPFAPKGTNLTYYAACSFMKDLARRGYAAISADAYYRTYAKDTAPAESWAKWKHVGTALGRDWPTWTGIGKLTADTRLLVDVLAADARVDADRIGMIGHSLGGKMAFYAGLLDPRVKAVVASDFGYDWDRSNWSDVWYWGDKLKEGRAAGLTHLDFLLADPAKPICFLIGQYDGLGTDTVTKGLFGNPQAVPPGSTHRRYFSSPQHRPSPEAVAGAYAFLDEFVKNRRP